MRIGIVVCSSCDLPKSFIEENDLHIMPVTLHLNEGDLIDDRDPVATQEFYKKYLLNKDLSSSTSSFSVERISEWFLDELVLKYDRVLVITMTKNRSPVFENATNASFAILQGYRQKRRDAGVKGSFVLRVLDSTSLFNGEAVLAYEAIRLKRDNTLSFDKWRKYLEDIADKTYAYLVPNDLYYIKKVASKRGEKSVSTLKYLMAKTLDIKPILCVHAGETFPYDKGKGFDEAVSKLFEHTKQVIDEGLGVPVVCMSYAGNPADITNRADYKDFVKHAQKNNISHTICVMSTTAGINIGPGGFSLAYARKD